MAAVMRAPSVVAKMPTHMLARRHFSQSVLRANPGSVPVHMRGGRALVRCSMSACRSTCRFVDPVPTWAQNCRGRDLCVCPISMDVCWNWIGFGRIWPETTKFGTIRAKHVPISACVCATSPISGHTTGKRGNFTGPLLEQRSVFRRASRPTQHTHPGAVARCVTWDEGFSLHHGSIGRGDARSSTNGVVTIASVGTCRGARTRPRPSLARAPAHMRMHACATRAPARARGVQS